MIPGTIAVIPPVLSSPPNLWAELERFETLLRASRSATALLTDWTGARAGGNMLELRAHLRSGGEPTPPPGLTERLEVADLSDIACRRVWLTRGARIYSCAANWYVPGRLTPAMLAVLERGTTPFGKAIEALEPMRDMLASERLWNPTRMPNEMSSRPPARLLRYRALVKSGAGQPVCEVDEVYTRNILVQSPA